MTTKFFTILFLRKKLLSYYIVFFVSVKLMIVFQSCGLDVEEEVSSKSQFSYYMKERNKQQNVSNIKFRHEF